MPPALSAEASEHLSRVRQLESEGQVNEAIALAREGATRMPAHYDWAGEITRLEADGKLARPYREGLEALAEGDWDDALRLLSWVAGKNARYQEVARHLYWARTGQDPEAERSVDEPAPPSLLSGAPSPLSSPLSWGLALVFGIMGFGLGWSLSSSRESAPEQVLAAEQPAPQQPAPEQPVAAAPPPAAPAEAAQPVAPAAVAEKPPEKPVEAAPTTSTRASAASSSGGSSSSRARSDVSDVENPNLMSEADQLALSCQGGSPSACFKVGDSYYFGRGVARDLGAAVRYYTKACDLGEARGCYNAADMVEKGESVPKDKVKAKALFDKGCKLGDTQSCSRKSFLDVETTEVP